MNATSYVPGAAGGNREWLEGPLTYLEPEQTPFVSSLNKRTDAKGTFYEQVADTLRKPRVTGSREGDSGKKGGNKAASRQRFGAYLGRYVEFFGVTDVQQAVSLKGGLSGIVANEYSWAAAKAVREVKRDLEASCCSHLDCQPGGPDQEMRMRGAFKWLDASQSPAVPAEFQPPAAQRLSGIATLTETGPNSLTSVLQSMFKASGGRRTYDGFIGADYMEQVNRFIRTGPELATNGTRTVFDGEKSKTIRLNVEVFDTTFGLVNFIPSTFLRFTETSEEGDPKALLLTYREYWELIYLEPLHVVDDEEDAGGKSGYVKLIAGLFCSMPKGNAFIYNT